MFDDFPPHEWHGSGACKRWFEDFESMSKAQGISNSRIALEPGVTRRNYQTNRLLGFPGKVILRSEMKQGYG
jgi:hypothetical protein